MATGYLLKVGDKTTCGGMILTGAVVIVPILVIVACAVYLSLYSEREADLQNWLAQTLWGEKAEREKGSVLGIIPMDDLMPYRNSDEEIKALNNILK